MTCSLEMMNRTMLRIGAMNMMLHCVKSRMLNIETTYLKRIDGIDSEIIT